MMDMWFNNYYGDEFSKYDDLAIELGLRDDELYGVPEDDEYYDDEYDDESEDESVEETAAETGSESASGEEEESF
jgi:hypothetical protein